LSVSKFKTTNRQDNKLQNRQKDYQSLQNMSPAHPAYALERLNQKLLLKLNTKANTNTHSKGKY